MSIERKFKVIYDQRPVSVIIHRSKGKGRGIRKKIFTRWESYTRTEIRK